LKKVNIFWFRRDLRLHDNAGLYHALKGNYPVVPVFIFDSNILDTLEEKKDGRVEFIRLACVPEFQDVYYPKPIVDHAAARLRCLEVYKAALSKK